MTPPERADDPPEKRPGVRVVGSNAPEPDDVDDAPEPSLREPSARNLPPAGMIALAVLALAGVFGTVFFYLRYHQLSGKGRAEAAVTKTSHDFLIALFDFDANNIDAAFNKVQTYATGDFENQALTFFSSNVRQALAKVQASSRGQIRSLYVESIQGDTATTFADVDETIANMNFSQPESDEVLLTLTLRKLPQGWRISQVTVLQAPAVSSNPVTPGARASTTTTPAASPTPTR